jgi:putative ABC transport system permease protein
MLSVFRSVWIGVQASWLEMLSNRFRSLLTLAGVGLAVGVVTVMMAFQTGTQVYIKNLVADMGGAGRVGMNAQPANSALESARFGRSQGVRLADADTLNTPQTIMVRASRIAQANLTIGFLGQTRTTQVRGIDGSALIQDEKVLVESGRFPFPIEYERGGRIAVVGWKVSALMQQIQNKSKGRATSPFSTSESISGSVLDIAGVPYTVIGSFTRNFKQWDRPGWWVYIPLRSLKRDFTGPNPGVEWMDLHIDPLDVEATVEGPLTEILKSMHRGAQDFGFRLFDFIGEYTSMMQNLRLVFILISGIALMVGGVNILNVMLSTLAERVQEIGVRKALGASPVQIFLQFLVESVTLSLAGGALGIGLGLPVLLFRDTIEKATSGIAPALTPISFVWVFGLTVGMGVASGLYPALKAARLSPMEALSYE